MKEREGKFDFRLIFLDINRTSEKHRSSNVEMKKIAKIIF